jgi:hypothetical protein
MATERRQYRFTIKEGAEGRPFLAAEQIGDVIDAFAQLGAILSLELRPGITLEQARDLERIINDRVTAVTLSYSLPPELSLPGARCRQ